MDSTTIENATNLNESTKKKIILTATGTRGDIQPVLVLAREFMERGYHVRIACHEVYKELANQIGVDDYCVLSGDPAKIMEDPAVKKMFQEGASMKAVQHLMEAGKPYIKKNLEELREYIKGMDAIVYNASTAFGAITLAEYYKIPCFGSYTIPVFPTSEMLPSVLGLRSSGIGLVNSMVHSVTNWLAWKMGLAEPTNWLREELKLKPIGSINEVIEMPIPVYHMFSPSVVSKPKDWKEHHYVTGWCFPPPTKILPVGSEPKTPFEWAPSEELLKFLKGDTKPIYVGFGSMSFIDIKDLVSMTIEVGDKLGHKMIINTGWSHIDDVPVSDIMKKHPNIFFLKYAPHDWLFPQCLIIVHHGGAGTTGASLASGNPMLICSVLADQPFWGKKMVELKVGQHIPMKELTADKMKKAITLLSSNEYQRNASRLGELLTNDNGSKDQVDGITKHLESGSAYIPKIE